MGNVYGRHPALVFTMISFYCWSAYLVEMQLVVGAATAKEFNVVGMAIGKKAEIYTIFRSPVP